MLSNFSQKNSDQANDWANKKREAMLKAQQIKDQRKQQQPIQKNDANKLPAIDQNNYQGTQQQFDENEPSANIISNLRNIISDQSQYNQNYTDNFTTNYQTEKVINFKVTENGQIDQKKKNQRVISANTAKNIMREQEWKSVLDNEVIQDDFQQHEVINQNSKIMQKDLQNRKKEQKWNNEINEILNSQTNIPKSRPTSNTRKQQTAQGYSIESNSNNKQKSKDNSIETTKQKEQRLSNTRKPNQRPPSSSINKSQKNLEQKQSNKQSNVWGRDESLQEELNRVKNNLNYSQLNNQTNQLKSNGKQTQKQYLDDLQLNRNQSESLHNLIEQYQQEYKKEQQSHYQLQMQNQNEQKIIQTENKLANKQNQSKDKFQQMKLQDNNQSKFQTNYDDIPVKANQQKNNFKNNIDEEIYYQNDQSKQLGNNQNKKLEVFDQVKSKQYNNKREWNNNFNEGLIEDNSFLNNFDDMGGNRNKHQTQNNKNYLQQNNKQWDNNFSETPSPNFVLNEEQNIDSRPQKKQKLITHQNINKNYDEIPIKKNDIPKSQNFALKESQKSNDIQNYKNQSQNNLQSQQQKLNKNQQWNNDIIELGIQQNITPKNQSINKLYQQSKQDRNQNSSNNNQIGNNQKMNQNVKNQNQYQNQVDEIAIKPSNNNAYNKPGTSNKAYTSFDDIPIKPAIKNVYKTFDDLPIQPSSNKNLYNNVDIDPFKQNKQIYNFDEVPIRQNANKFNDQMINTKSSKQNIQEYDEIGPLIECTEGCGRKFKFQALEKHANVCRKVFQEKRKIYNSENDRIIDKEHKDILNQAKQQAKLDQRQNQNAQTIEKIQKNQQQYHTLQIQSLESNRQQSIQQKQPINNKINNDKQQQQNDQQYLQECSEGCGRRFNAEALEKHQNICKKVFQSKRKQFSTAEQRIIDESQLKLQAKIPQKKNNQPSTTQKVQNQNGISKNDKKLKWKQQSEAFRANLRAARNGGKLSTKDQALLDQAYNEQFPTTPCNFCGRRFNETAAIRHIAFCEKKYKDSKMNIKNQTVKGTNKRK